MATLLIMGVALVYPPLNGRLPVSAMAHAAEGKSLQENQYDGVGVLDDIQAGGVVINDIYYRLAPDVEFKSPDTKPPARVSFTRGDTVGFFKDQKGRIAVLWRLKKNI